jgi:aminoglycoside phosphotransferase (APT) family kinase protein
MSSSVTSEAPLDENAPRPIRSDEERFDPGPVEAFLRRHVDVPPAALEVLQFGIGNSNLTYLLRLGDREFVMRRPPLGPLLPTAHDMHREFRVLSALSGTDAPCPRPVAYCDDASLIGAPFYIMERLHGFVVGRQGAPELDTPEKTAAVGWGLVEALAKLHRVDYEAVGLADFGRPEGFVQRQIDRWRKQWLKAKTRDLPILDELDAWLREHAPAACRNAVVHGDVSPSNTMFDRDNPRRVVAFLDWEMSTLGDPLCDVGYFIAMWPEESDSGARRKITPDHLRRPGIPMRRELIGRYASLTGFEIADMKFYETLAIYKLAIILEGIFSRYKRGQTSDPRFVAIGERMAVTAQAAYENIRSQ